MGSEMCIRDRYLQKEHLRLFCKIVLHLNQLVFRPAHPLYRVHITLYRSERVPRILDHGRILADLGQDVVVVLYRGISQTIERANTGIQFWREFGMHPIENGHHQPGDLAPNVHVLIYALSETDALLILVVHKGEPRFHAIAGVVDCGMYFPEGSHTSFTVSYTHLTLPTKRIV